MTKQLTAHVSEELYEKVDTYFKEHRYKSVSECVANILVTFFENQDKTVTFIHSESRLEYTNHIDDLKQTIEEYKDQLRKKDEQLKTKDQQIFSLIAVQKDLTEKTTEQVKLLNEKTNQQLMLLEDRKNLKKWYHFWK